MTREEVDAEFHGNEWDIGYVMGLDGLGLTAAAVTMAEVLDRPLTPLETLKFSQGWTAGNAARPTT